MATKMEVVQNMMRLNKNKIVSRDILKLLANQCIEHGYLMTEAQLKRCAARADALEFAASHPASHDDIMALGYVLTLREPVFLDTFFKCAFTFGDVASQCLCRYLRVCTPEAARNILKNTQACEDKMQFLDGVDTEREKVFEYALWDPFDTVEIVNEYGAAWYILTGYKDVNIHGLWSNKQLKRVLSRPEAIDRYAQIEYIEYDDIHVAQSEIAMEISAALTAKGAKMTLFHNSYELAEEGIRMNNCIGTYWQHDTSTLLFSVDYKDRHMDVEVGTNYYGDWEVFQVLEKNNTGSQITTEVFEIIADTVYDFSKGAGEDKIDRDDCEIVDANEAGLDELDLDFEF